MKKKQPAYTEAFEKLEALVEQLEDGDIELDQLTDKIKEANGLIAICETKLRSIEKEVNGALSQP